MVLSGWVNQLMAAALARVGRPQILIARSVVDGGEADGHEGSSREGTGGHGAKLLLMTIGEAASGRRIPMSMLQ